MIKSTVVLKVKIAYCLISVRALDLSISDYKMYLHFHYVVLEDEKDSVIFFW